MARAFICGFTATNELDGYFAPKPLVFGGIDLTHASRAQAAQNAIMPDSPRFHVVRIIPQQDKTADHFRSLCLGPSARLYRRCSSVDKNSSNVSRQRCG